MKFISRVRNGLLKIFMSEMYFIDYIGFYVEYDFSQVLNIVLNSQHGVIID